MEYTITLLAKHRRDLIATANELEMRMGKMLDPHTEATVDKVRQHRLRAEEIQRAIAILEKNDGVVSIEDVKR